MSKQLTRQNNKLQKRPKTEEEELLELTDEFYSDRPPLNFSTYQQEVMLNTPEWPIGDSDKVFQQITEACNRARGGDKHAVVIQAGVILRHLAELADYVPISLERIAHISLSELPTTGPELSTNPESIKKII